MKAVGIRYSLPLGIGAELYDTGNVMLRWEHIKEYYGVDGRLVDTTYRKHNLRKALGSPTSLTMFIMQHGRPRGTIWEETT